MKTKILILTAVFLMASCTKPDTIVKNPSPKDIEGSWETLHENDVLPYFLLKMDLNGNGVVIAANEEAAGKIFDLHSFISQEKSFLITGDLSVEEDEEEKETVKFRGTLDNGLLCFEPLDIEEETDEIVSICFIEVGKIEKYRKLALEVENEPLL